LFLSNGSGNVVEGNYIGTDVTGLHALPNGYFAGAIVLGPDATSNLIGGTTPAARNIISGNQGNESGIFIGRNGAGGDAPSGNLIEGNYIGTDVTGEAVLGDGADGIHFQEGTNNTIGGTVAGAGNVISGNGEFGIYLGHFCCSSVVTGNVVQGNLIGTDASGTRAMANADQTVGVFLGAALDDPNNLVANNLIGGTTPAARNVISENTDWGIEFNTLANANLVEGNYIGTDITGTQPLGNGPNGGGVLFGSGALNNTLGGMAAGAGNLIADNSTLGGVVLSQLSPLPAGDTIRGNSIHDNAGLGIDLGADGVTPNDSHAGQPGPNNWENFPVLSAAYAGASTILLGTFHSTPSSTFTLDFYANATPDPTGYGEGQYYLGSTIATTDSSGNASFTATGLGASSPGQWISATATDSSGDTSEFSLDVRASYVFSGFLAPLSTGLSYALGRTIPIKFQLTDSNGAFITSLSAVTSLQVAPVNANGSLGTPSNPTGSGGTGLRYDATANQYVFNWQTKGLTAGSYAVLLTLADHMVHQSRTIQLTAAGGSAGLLSDTTGGSTAATAGALLAGNLTLSISDPNGLFTPDERARIADAIAAIDATIAPYGVAITQVGDGDSTANVTLDTGSTSAVGGYADGVLGCETDTGEITLIQGWNWYAGGDPTAIGSGQYDFETVLIHELGHALGLGHSADATSVMYATLAAGTANRVMTTADLNVPDTDTGACGLHAAGSRPSTRPPIRIATSGSSAVPTGWMPLDPSAIRDAALERLSWGWSSPDGAGSYKKTRVGGGSVPRPGASLGSGGPRTLVLQTAHVDSVLGEMGNLSCLLNSDGKELPGTKPKGRD
jgi:hypothetical protein